MVLPGKLEEGLAFCIPHPLGLYWDELSDLSLWGLTSDGMESDFKTCCGPRDLWSMLWHGLLGVLY